jgi:hypothetical protein
LAEVFPFAGGFFLGGFLGLFGFLGHGLIVQAALTGPPKLLNSECLASVLAVCIPRF